MNIILFTISKPRPKASALGIRLPYGCRSKTGLGSVYEILRTENSLIRVWNNAYSFRINKFIRFWFLYQD